MAYYDTKIVNCINATNVGIPLPQSTATSVVPPAEEAGRMCHREDLAAVVDYSLVYQPLLDIIVCYSDSPCNTTIHLKRMHVFADQPQTPPVCPCSDFLQEI